MSEGGIADLTGGEEEAAEAREAAVGADAIAAGMALGRAADSPEVNAAAVAFLDSQRHLVELQTANLHSGHRLVVAGARMKHWMDRIRLVLLAGGALGAALVVLLLLITVWNATQARGLVIEPFAVPPDLAAQQIDGKQLAALVGDKLASIDSQARSFRAETSFQTDWDHDVRIEIPGTGISFGEFNQELIRQLGSETRIGGTLFHTDGALRLSLRAGEGAASEVAGDAEHLDALAQAAAEAVFAKTQPYRYSKYLELAGRSAEAMKVARELAREGPAEERAWAWAQISNLLSAMDVVAAARAGYRAIALDHGNAMAYLNTSNAEIMLGHDQRSDVLAARSVALTANGGGGLSKTGIATQRFNAFTLLQGQGAYREAINQLRQVDPEQLYSTVGQGMQSHFAELYALDHDRAGFAATNNLAFDAQEITHLYLENCYCAPTYQGAVERGDWAGALAAAQSQLDALAKQPEGPELARVARERYVLPHMAYALARLGRLDEANTIAMGLPGDCYLCLRTRAQVAAMRGDWPAANRDFSEAIRQNPALPFADLEWGQMLLERGQAAAAIPHLSRAASVAPQFADPLKYWGDALRRTGNASEALSKYRQALPLAPNWEELKRAIQDLSGKQ
jgi:tetratricopeptide (TPR) repeat protein